MLGNAATYRGRAFRKSLDYEVCNIISGLIHFVNNLKGLLCGNCRQGGMDGGRKSLGVWSWELYLFLATFCLYICFLEILSWAPFLCHALPLWSFFLGVSWPWSEPLKPWVKLNLSSSKLLLLDILFPLMINWLTHSCNSNLNWDQHFIVVSYFVAVLGILHIAFLAHTRQCTIPLSYIVNLYCSFNITKHFLIACTLLW